MIFLIGICINAQSDQFNLDSYRIFLENNQNLTSGQLLNFHPAGLFKDELKITPEKALYFDSIAAKYELTNYENELIRKNGFMVTERLKSMTFGHAFFDIFQKDLPVFVSTDAILHAFHRSYDRILRDIETSFLIPNLENMLFEMKSQLPALSEKYSTYPELTEMLQDVDIYLTIPLKLLGHTVEPY